MKRTTTNSKINLESIVEKINKKYNIDLKTLLQSYEIGYKSLYIYLYILAQEILKQFPYNISSEDVKKNPEIICATNVRALSACLDIYIEEKGSISYKDEEFIEPYAFGAYYDYYYINSKFLSKTIYLSEKIGAYSERYDIAILISDFIISFIIEGKENLNLDIVHHGCFSKSKKMQMRTILASFILMPINTLLVLRENYIKKCLRFRKVDYYELLNYIGCQLVLCQLHTVICLQNIMYLGEILYNYNGELGFELDICKEIRSYKNLFR